MKEKEAGSFWANLCATQSLIAKLVEKNVLAPDDVLDLIGDAEDFLAGLDPDQMSDASRDHAKVLLQAFGRIR